MAFWNDPNWPAYNFCTEIKGWDSNVSRFLVVPIVSFGEISSDFKLLFNFCESPFNYMRHIPFVGTARLLINRKAQLWIFIGSLYRRTRFNLNIFNFISYATFISELFSFLFDFSIDDSSNKCCDNDNLRLCLGYFDDAFLIKSDFIEVGWHVCAICPNWLVNSYIFFVLYKQFEGKLFLRCIQQSGYLKLFTVSHWIDL